MSSYSQVKAALKRIPELSTKSILRWTCSMLADLTLLTCHALLGKLVLQNHSCTVFPDLFIRIYNTAPNATPAVFIFIHFYKVSSFL